MVVAKSFRSLARMTSDPLSADSITRLMIFGHPAHELALFGFLQRFQPQVIIVTDGGSEERVRQSRASLDLIGLEGTYLDFAENDFYVALLRNDVSFFETAADCLRGQIAAASPSKFFAM
jgi:hypothetical protein